MRDRRVRFAFVGLILGLPWMLCLRSPRQPDPPARAARFGYDFKPTPMVWGVELLVVFGLLHAARERKRLLSARAARHAAFGAEASTTGLSSNAVPDSAPVSVSAPSPISALLPVRSQTVPAA